MKIDTTTRIVVLMGGLSTEREVSLETGRGVHKALTELGYNSVALDWHDDLELPTALTECGAKVVWNALHGTYGEDGAIQGLLTSLGIPFTGAGILASSLAMDKVASKRIFMGANITTPPWAIVSSPSQLNDWPVPCVVKPSREGSSVGVTIITKTAQRAAALALAESCKGVVLVEDYIAGAELHVAILDQAILGSVEVRPSVEFYDYDAKYKRHDTQYLIPPTLDASVVENAEKLALAAHHAVGCDSYSRVDLRIDESGTAFVLEVNTLPGMTSHSLLPKIAASRGISYGALCERILLGASCNRGS